MSDSAYFNSNITLKQRISLTISDPVNNTIAPKHVQPTSLADNSEKTQSGMDKGKAFLQLLVLSVQPKPNTAIHHQTPIMTPL